LQHIDVAISTPSTKELLANFFVCFRPIVIGRVTRNFDERDFKQKSLTLVEAKKNSLWYEEMFF
jgi:hypothetical protein